MTVALISHRTLTVATALRHAAATELLETEQLRAEFALMSAADRGYLISREHEFIERRAEHRGAFDRLLKTLDASAPTAGEHQLIDEIERRHEAHEAAISSAFALADAGNLSAASEMFLQTILPLRDATQHAIHGLATERTGTLEAAEGAADRAQRRRN